jgi:hypothetical protein
MDLQREIDSGKPSQKIQALQRNGNGKKSHQTHASYKQGLTYAHEKLLGKALSNVGGGSFKKSICRSAH